MGRLTSNISKGNKFGNWLATCSDLNLVAEVERLGNMSTPSATTIYYMSKEAGYDGSISTIYTWIEAVKKIGMQAERLNSQLDSYKGVDAAASLEKSIVQFSQLMDLAMTNAITADPEEISPESWLKSISNLGKEMRSATNAANSLKYVKERKSLIMAGANRLAQELSIIFTDTPFEPALQAALQSALDRIESEE